MSKNGRDKEGRFKPGNRCGRKAGVPNQGTIDVRVLKQHILDSWNVVDGDKLLARLAKRRPLDYLRLIVQVLPREDGPTPGPFVTYNPQIHDAQALDFIKALDAEAARQGTEVTPQIVEEMLIRHSRCEDGSST